MNIIYENKKIGECSYPKFQKDKDKDKDKNILIIEIFNIDPDINLANI